MAVMNLGLYALVSAYRPPGSPPLIDVQAEIARDAKKRARSLSGPGAESKRTAGSD